MKKLFCILPFILVLCYSTGFACTMNNDKHQKDFQISWNHNNNLSSDEFWTKRQSISNLIAFLKEYLKDRCDCCKTDEEESDDNEPIVDTGVTFIDNGFPQLPPVIIEENNMADTIPNPEPSPFILFYFGILCFVGFHRKITYESYVRNKRE